MKRMAYLIITMCVLFTVRAESIEWEKTEVEGTLWPGESYSIYGTTITFIVEQDPKEATKTRQFVRIKGATSSLDIHDNEETYTLIDNALIKLNPKATVEKGKNGTRRIRRLEYIFYRHPNRHKTFIGQREGYYISNRSPQYIDGLKLILSHNPTPFPGRIEYHILTVQDATGDIVGTMPVNERAKRKFGLYDIDVYNFFTASKTACFGVRRTPDLSIRGRDAYVERLGMNGQMCGKLLDDLASRFGFEVEWKQVAGDPKSIEYGKKTSARGNRHSTYTYRRITVGKMLAGGFPSLGTEWKTPTHLVVWAKDYEKAKKIKEEAQRQKKMKEEEKQRQKEKYREENKLLVEKYNKEYLLSTQVYPLLKLTPVTAKAMIEPELRCFYLFGGSPKLGLHEYSADTKPDKYAKDVRIEKVVADDKGNNLIITAIPKTHEKIKQMLEKMESVVKSDAAVGEITRYRLEAVLLAGIDPSSGSPDDLSLSFPHRGSMAQIVVISGSEVHKGDTLAYLDIENHKRSLEKIQVQMRIDEEQLEILSKRLERSQKLYKSGTVSAKEMNDAKIEYSKVAGKIQACKLDISEVKSILDLCTLKAPVDGVITHTAHLPYRNFSHSKGSTMVKLKPPTHSASTQSQTPNTAARYGISQQDLELFGLKGVKEIGRGVVTLTGVKGETGTVKVSFSDKYSCQIKYDDTRPPYLIVRGVLNQGEKTLLENSLFLEAGKPSTLGLTNMREALILVLKRLDKSEKPKQ
jgi:hypothetical protein